MLLVLAAPQLVFQVVNDLPMQEVSRDLIERQGSLVRLVLIPTTVVFLGPALLPVWVRGLLAPWRNGPQSCARNSRWILISALLVLVWSLIVPGQPYYAVPALFPALAVGWVHGEGIYRSGRRLAAALAAQSAIAAVICLPLTPATSPVLPHLARLDPTFADQIGWQEYATQISVAAGPVPVVTDRYDLAGAVHRYTGRTAPRLASGHNALWGLGPPSGDTILLVGDIARSKRDLFDRCEDAGNLRKPTAVPSRVASTPMALCHGPRGSWSALWPAFRRIAG